MVHVRKRNICACVHAWSLISPLSLCVTPSHSSLSLRFLTPGLSGSLPSFLTTCLLLTPSLYSHSFPLVVTPSNCAYAPYLLVTPSLSAHFSYSLSPFLPLPPSPGYSPPILPTRFFCMFPPFLHRLCHLVTPLPFFPLISSAHSLPFSTAFVTWSLTSHSSHSPRLPATHFLSCSLTAFLTLPSSPGHSFPFLSLPFLMAPLPLPHYITW